MVRAPAARSLNAVTDRSNALLDSASILEVLRRRATLRTAFKRVQPTDKVATERQFTKSVLKPALTALRTPDSSESENHGTTKKQSTCGHNRDAHAFCNYGVESSTK
jgi:hypothetical protein